MSSTIIRPLEGALIRWSKRGRCGDAGCTDPECGCALCGRPIGVPEEDPRWQSQDEYCAGCPLCEDEVPLMLFRGEGRNTEQAVFHQACFQRVVFVRSQAGARSS